MTDVRNVIIGCIIVMVSNTFQVSHIYTAKYQIVTPGQILTARGVLQTTVFGIWAAEQNIRLGKPSKLSIETLVMVTFGNTLLSGAQLSIFTAVKMMPLSDCVALAFTSPLFTLLANALILT